ncbi:MAG: DMT family transporter [Candidatus Babeliales bacterium]
MISILFLYALCASSFTISKAILAYSPPIFFVGVRMVWAAAVLFGILKLYDKKSYSIKKADCWLFFNIIIFHIYCAYVFDIWSLQFMTSFKSSFFFNLSPFITAILSFFMFGEVMTAKKLVGMIIGFLGFIPMITQQAPQEAAWGEILGVSWPEIVLLGSIVSSCIGWISMRKLMHSGSYSPLFINGVGMLGGGLLALGTSYVTETWSIHIVSEWWPFLALTALIIIVCNGIFYNLYGYLLKEYTATFLSFAGFTTSLFAALFGVIFLGETVTWHFFIASAIVSMGLYIFYQEELRQGYIKRRV